jgi:hypothetical protein
MNGWNCCLRVGLPGLLILAVHLSAVGGQAGSIEDRCWPVQKLPKAVVRASNPPVAAFPHAGLQMMVQSVAGLAAQAVNEGRGDEMVWVDSGNRDVEDWFARMLAAHPSLRQSGAFGPWELVDRYSKKGIIKGYILYRLDRSEGEINAHRAGMDCSVNVATSLAGLLDAIIVAEELEADAKAHGLKLLLDARDKTQSWCFQTYKARFNSRMLCTQDPRKPHVRDLAIAQRAFTAYGGGEPIPAAMEWLEPLSPILGWNGGDEFATTDLSTRYGHIQTATDWCINLPVLMAGSEKLDLPRLKRLDPGTIDWNDHRSGVSFIGTDGDNVQWFEGNFFRGNPSYWSNPERGKIPYGWSCCFAHLAQLCPQVIEYAQATRSTNDSFIEWGGGYYYPDRFGLARSNRWELLACQGRRTWELMKKTGSSIVGFNVSQFDSPDALKAYEVLASQADSLLAILIFQYSPYEAGMGKMFWVKDRNGIELPVITARYSIWEHQNSRPQSGTPAKVAREIRQTIDTTPQEQLPHYDWVITHAWSYFKRAPGVDETAEDMPQDNAAAQGGVRGYYPVTWCAEGLQPGIRVISPEEMVWRIRMQHDPGRTEGVIRRRLH